MKELKIKRKKEKEVYFKLVIQELQIQNKMIKNPKPPFHVYKIKNLRRKIIELTVQK